MLKNPSSSVVSVEIRILSLYPAPLEALDLLTKWYVVQSKCIISQRMIQLMLFSGSASTSHYLMCLTVLLFFIGRFNISPLSVNISTTEFSLLATPPKVKPDINYVYFLNKQTGQLTHSLSCLLSFGKGFPANLFHSFLCLCVQAGENVGEMTGESVLRLLLQPWEAREVAVVFTPSEHKPTTTILIIRY